MGDTIQAEVSACMKLGIVQSVAKYFAMTRYNLGLATFEETEAAFRQHPEWRDA